MYKIAICDDISLDIDIINELIEEIAYANNIKGLSYFRYGNGKDLLENMIERFDVIFLDIQMEYLNGSEVSQAIRRIDTDVILVFCSCLRNPSPDLFKVQPYRYIVKQFSKNQIREEIAEILNRMVQEKKKYIYTSRNGQVNKINLNDIVYISLLKRGCEININPTKIGLYGSSKINCEKSLKQLHEMINNNYFVYAHNSYIINIEYVTKISRKEVLLGDYINLTIARSKEKHLRKCVTEYITNNFYGKTGKL